MHNNLLRFENHKSSWMVIPNLDDKMSIEFDTDLLNSELDNSKEETGCHITSICKKLPFFEHDQDGFDLRKDYPEELNLFDQIGSVLWVPEPDAIKNPCSNSFEGANDESDNLPVNAFLLSNHIADQNQPRVEFSENFQFNIKPFAVLSVPQGLPLTDEDFNVIRLAFAEANGLVPEALILQIQSDVKDEFYKEFIGQALSFKQLTRACIRKEQMYKKIFGFCFKRLIEDFRTTYFSNANVSSHSLKREFLDFYFDKDRPLDFDKYFLVKEPNAKDTKFFKYKKGIFKCLSSNTPFKNILHSYIKIYIDNCTDNFDKELTRLLRQVQTWRASNPNKNVENFFKRTHVIGQKSIQRATGVAIPWSPEEAIMAARELSARLCKGK